MAVELTWQILLLLFVVAFCASFIDTIAGGGGLIVIPTLLLTGFPALFAIGTNKVQSVLGTMTATLSMLKMGLINLKVARIGALMAFIGSAVGSLLLQFVPLDSLNIIIPILLLLIGFYFLLVPSVGQVEQKPRISEARYNTTVLPAIGFYDGVFGPGAGSMYALSNIMLRGRQIISATAHAKLFNVSSNLGSVIIFVVGGKVVWAAAGVMMIGSISGAALGSRVVVAHGTKIIRPLMVIMCFLMVGRYFYQMYS